MAELENLRPVITHTEHDFGKLLGKVLSPSQPLQQEEFLRGRADQLDGMKRALYQPGRHVLIHGLRGVGKSSLAQTAAFQLAKSADPIIIGCDRNSTFGSVIRELFDEAENKNPLVDKTTKEGNVSFARFGITAGEKLSVQEGVSTDPSSINEAVRLIDFLCKTMGNGLVFVIDEFDQIESKPEQSHFANFIKQISDRHIDAKFIFCGIGESAQVLMDAHASADRYFHTVSLGQLPWEARYTIVDDAADRLGIRIDRDTTIRIARISDGFPHYVHFISEKLFWRVFLSQNNGIVTTELFAHAMADAASSMDMKLRGPYETATLKYSDDYESVLWAAADGHELKRRSVDIFESYQRIMKETSKTPLDRTKFNQRLNSLKRDAHASILAGSRQGWYEFREKMIRGYVRLRAEQKDIVLESDHPKDISRTGK
jgi:uncharacterized protein